MKNLPSHENQDLEKKRTLHTVLIIIAALTFASTFLNFLLVFSRFIQFFVSLFCFSVFLPLSGLITPPLRSELCLMERIYFFERYYSLALGATQ
jgi:hypothetical protein